MPETDLTLTPEFEPPSREAWLALVDKVLKGAEFEKRLVSRTADGLAIQPLYTRSDADACGRPRAKRAAARCRASLGHPPAPCRAGCQGGQRRHPGGPPGRRDLAAAADQGAGPDRPLLSARDRWPRRSRACSSTRCTIALDARENTMDAAGSLIEIWREAGIGENSRHGAFNLDPLGMLAATGTLYYPAQSVVRDRRQVRLRLPHHDARHGAARRRPPLSRGRRQRGAGARRHAGDAGCLPARLRGAWG